MIKQVWDYLPIMVQSDITAVILAGGRATRLGGADKGLLPLDGEPLVAHVLRRIAPQVGAVLINCNRNAEAYARFGCPLFPDRLADFPGPLAGLHAACHAAQTPLILTVPCDSPFLPSDLAEKLLAALPGNDAAVAAGERREPVFALYRASLLPRLETFLAGGGRKVGQWQGELHCGIGDFSEQAEVFRNFNTADDWDRTC